MHFRRAGGHKHYRPSEYQNNGCSDRRCEVGVEPGHADLGEKSGQSGKKSRCYCPEKPLHTFERLSCCGMELSNLTQLLNPAKNRRSLESACGSQKKKTSSWVLSNAYQPGQPTG